MSNGVHLIQHTVPTIAAVGAVTHTTDRLTRRGRRATKPAIPKTHRFNGKVYHLANTHTTKRVAENDAKHFRKAGHGARVVYVGGKYAVYVR